MEFLNQLDELNTQLAELTSEQAAQPERLQGIYEKPIADARQNLASVFSSPEVGQFIADQSEQLGSDISQIQGLIDRNYYTETEGRDVMVGLVADEEYRPLRLIHMLAKAVPEADVELSFLDEYLGESSPNDQDAEEAKAPVREKKDDTETDSTTGETDRTRSITLRINQRTSGAYIGTGRVKKAKLNSYLKSKPENTVSRIKMLQALAEWTHSHNKDEELRTSDWWKLAFEDSTKPRASETQFFIKWMAENLLHRGKPVVVQNGRRTHAAGFIVPEFRIDLEIVGSPPNTANQPAKKAAAKKTAKKASTRTEVSPELKKAVEDQFDIESAIAFTGLALVHHHHLSDEARSLLELDQIHDLSIEIKDDTERTQLRQQGFFAVQRILKSQTNVNNFMETIEENDPRRKLIEEFKKLRFEMSDEYYEFMGILRKSVRTNGVIETVISDDTAAQVPDKKVVVSSGAPKGARTRKIPPHKVVDKDGYTPQEHELRDRVAGMIDPLIGGLATSFHDDSMRVRPSKLRSIHNTAFTPTNLESISSSGHISRNDKLLDLGEAVVVIILSDDQLRNEYGAKPKRKMIDAEIDVFIDDFMYQKEAAWPAD